MGDELSYGFIHQGARDAIECSLAFSLQGAFQHTETPIWCTNLALCEKSVAEDFKLFMFLNEGAKAGFLSLSHLPLQMLCQVLSVLI